MIRVGSIEEIPKPARDRIKARVMRRFLQHLRDRPEISDATLRLALGIDRHGLEAMWAELAAAGSRSSAAPVAERSLAPGIASAQAPMGASLAQTANAPSPPERREASRQAGSCCRRAAVRD